MNKVLIIDIDSDREETPILLAHGNRIGDGISPVVDSDMDHESIMVDDMSSLCQALVLLIHSAGREGVKSSAQSLRDCIRHLEDGFGDSSYQATFVRADGMRLPGVAQTSKRDRGYRFLSKSWPGILTVGAILLAAVLFGYAFGLLTSLL